MSHPYRPPPPRRVYRHWFWNRALRALAHVVVFFASYYIAAQCCCGSHKEMPRRVQCIERAAARQPQIGRTK